MRKDDEAAAADADVEQRPVDVLVDIDGVLALQTEGGKRLLPRLNAPAFNSALLLALQQLRREFVDSLDLLKIGLFTTAEATQDESPYPLETNVTYSHMLQNIMRIRFYELLHLSQCQPEGMISSASGLITTDSYGYGASYFRHQRYVMRKLGQELPLSNETKERYPYPDDDYTENHYQEFLLHDNFYGHLVRTLLACAAADEEVDLTNFSFLDNMEEQGFLEAFHPLVSLLGIVQAEIIELFKAFVHRYLSEERQKNYISKLIDFFKAIDWPDAMDDIERVQLFRNGKGHMLFHKVQFAADHADLVVFDDNPNVIGLCKRINNSSRKVALLGEQRTLSAMQVVSSQAHHARSCYQLFLHYVKNKQPHESIVLEHQEFIPWAIKQSLLKKLPSSIIKYSEDEYEIKVITTQYGVALYEGIDKGEGEFNYDPYSVAISGVHTKLVPIAHEDGHVVELAILLTKLQIRCPLVCRKDRRGELEQFLQSVMKCHTSDAVVALPEVQNYLLGEEGFEVLIGNSKIQGLPVSGVKLGSDLLLLNVPKKAEEADGTDKTDMAVWPAGISFKVRVISELKGNYTIRLIARTGIVLEFRTRHLRDFLAEGMGQNFNFEWLSQWVLASELYIKSFSEKNDVGVEVAEGVLLRPISFDSSKILDSRPHLDAKQYFKIVPVFENAHISIFIYNMASGWRKYAGTLSEALTFCSERYKLADELGKGHIDYPLKLGPDTIVSPRTKPSEFTEATLLPNADERFTVIPTGEDKLRIYDKDRGCLFAYPAVDLRYYSENPPDQEIKHRFWRAIDDTYGIKPHEAVRRTLKHAFWGVPKPYDGTKASKAEWFSYCFGGFIIEPLVNLVKLPLEILPYAIEQAVWHLWRAKPKNLVGQIIRWTAFFLLAPLFIPAKILRLTARAILSPVKSFNAAKSIKNPVGRFFTRAASVIVSIAGITAIAVFAPWVLVKLGAASAVQASIVLPHIASGVKSALVAVGLVSKYFAAQALSLIVTGFAALVRFCCKVASVVNKHKSEGVRKDGYTLFENDSENGADSVVSNGITVTSGPRAVKEGQDLPQRKQHSDNGLASATNEDANQQKQAVNDHEKDSSSDSETELQMSPEELEAFIRQKLEAYNQQNLAAFAKFIKSTNRRRRQKSTSSATAKQSDAEGKMSEEQLEAFNKRKLEDLNKQKLGVFTESSKLKNRRRRQRSEQVTSATAAAVQPEQPVLPAQLDSASGSDKLGGNSDEYIEVYDAAAAAAQSGSGDKSSSPLTVDGSADVRQHSSSTQAQRDKNSREAAFNGAGLMQPAADRCAVEAAKKDTDTARSSQLLVYGSDSK